jgi:M6 family metalloprotease-like protein
MIPLIRFCTLLPLWLAVWFLPFNTKAATVSDFGQGRMNINGHPLLGSRPLLVVLVNFQGQTPIATNRAFYSNLVFNTSGSLTQHVNGFFAENSNGRFSWSLAGVVGPLLLNANDAFLPQPAFHSNIVHEVMARDLFDFRPYRGADTNVTQDELQIMAFSSMSSLGARPFNCVQASGVPVSVCGEMADLLDQWGFSSICHELGHTLGAGEPALGPLDVYGAQAGRNYQVSLMGPTIGGTNNEPSTWHMDPWHKMQLGWSEPRIVNLRTGGVFTLPAAHRLDASAPIILYDPSHGVREFFMLEYRAQAGYDREVTTNGLAIWHIKHDLNNVPELIPSESGLPAQIGWSICPKCAGLWYAPSNSVSRCPADGLAHSDGNSLHWLVFDDAGDPGQPGWRRCRKCEGLFFNPNQSISACPVSGRHEVPTDSVLNYSVRAGQVDGGQLIWCRCSKCQGLIDTNTLAKATGALTCPAGGMHNAVTNTMYSIHLTDRAMLCLAPPDLRRGNQLWQGGDTTTNLEWFDKATAATRIHVRPFPVGSDNITVEVLAERDTWVNFGYTGATENGSFTTPYKTMGRGVTNASWGGTVKFAAGSSAETNTIDKRLMLEAPLGPVTIGQ